MTLTSLESLTMLMEELLNESWPGLYHIFRLVYEFVRDSRAIPLHLRIIDQTDDEVDRVNWRKR